MRAHQESAKCGAAYAEALISRYSQMKASTPEMSECPSTRAPIICEGLRFTWTPGSPFLTYPFAAHDPSSRQVPPYTILDVDAKDSAITVRSHLCSGVSNALGVACSACQESVDAVHQVLSRVSKDSSKFRPQSATHASLQKRLKVVSKGKESAQMKYLNAKRDLARLRVHKKTWDDLRELFGSKDVCALPRLFRNAKSFGWSDEMLLKMGKQAAEGTYRPKNFSRLEIDLATVVYDLGGDAALHALHNSPFSFPCRNTLSERRSECRLRISNGEVLISDLLHNIEAVFKPEPGAAAPKKVGITCCLDEVATNGRLCWIKSTDEVVGLCEHSTELPSTKMGKNLDVVRAIAEAVRNGDVHVGQEVLVAAFARNDIRDYGAKVVLILSTCKRGSFQDAALILEKLRQAWKLSPYGEAMHGAIWSFASDGDPKRRPALYLHCVVRELKPEDALFKHLGSLRGFNLNMGPNFETQDLDWKHNMKRLCKLLCTREGILINDTLVNKTVLASWLGRLTDVDWSDDPLYSLLNPVSNHSQEIQALLSPKDPQDVPRAIKLLNIIGELRNLDRAEMNPSELHTHDALCLLGELLEALVDPFIDPTLDLSQQITSLAKFAFILCALFIKHESAFMPSHLYSDFQCMVRTAIARVAHTKVLDPDLRVFLCQLGDDVLEVLFGCIRMIGGHAPNVSPDVFCHRAATAMRLRKIFELYPEWERKAVRLMLKRTRDADHLSPRNWQGELRARFCDLLKCWEDGMRLAADVLRKYGYIFDFSVRFSKPGVDLLRPKGGKYPGISAEVDRSLPDTTENADEPGTSTRTSVQTSKETPDESAIYPFRSYDGRVALDAEKAISATASEFISPWIEVTSGKKVHKETTLRYFMNPTSDIASGKSNDRLTRVRPFEGNKIYSEISSPTASGSLPRNKVLLLGSLFATLLSTDQKGVALCIMQCTVIKQKSQLIESAPVDEISLTNSAYEIGGQILNLLPFRDVSSDRQQQPNASRTDNRIFWLWNSSFVCLKKLSKRSPNADAAAYTGLANLNFTLNGRLVHPLTNGECESVAISESHALNLSTQHRELNPEDLTHRASTWCIWDHNLREAQALLIKRCEDEENLRGMLPVAGGVLSGRFPYHIEPSMSGHPSSIVHYTTSIKPPEQGPHRCPVCQVSVAQGEMQNHMGKHILRAQYGITDDSHGGSVSLDYPCGFCGQSMVGSRTCEVRNNSKGKINSACKYAHPLLVSWAARSTDSRPSSNHPIECSLNGCGEVHWKYNMSRHLEDRHPTSWRELLTANEALRSSLEISQKEKESFGVGGGDLIRILRSRANYDDRREGRFPTTRDTHNDSPRRTRTSGTTQHARYGTPARIPLRLTS